MITSSWKKSTRSNPSGNCLEAKTENGVVLVRDTKLGEASPVLNFSEGNWRTFLREIEDGFACPMGGEIETWADHGGGITLLNRTDTTVRLAFTGAEWNAFVRGVENREFDLPLS